MHIVVVEIVVVVYILHIHVPYILYKFQLEASENKNVPEEMKMERGEKNEAYLDSEYLGTVGTYKKTDSSKI